MISESYIKDLLLSMGYIKKNHIYEKFFPSVDCYIKVDLKNRTIIYPEDRGMTISNRTTCNFSAPENFVVLECVTRLFDKGYRPKHLNLEKEWTLGHESKGGRADICVSDQEGNTLFIVECKTYGREYEKEYKNIVNDGGQLFSYWQQERSCKFLVLYASKYEGKQIKWDTESIDCSDDANIVALSQKDDSIKLFKNAHTVSELYSVWDETYEKRFSGDVIFRDDSSAYQIGVKPLRKADLKDFADNNKIVNKFEEILRHNNVSDKENAFNRLVALFICKLVDEIQKDMEEIVDFQYKVGTDTYESLQDRLQRLHKEGMEKFMKEEIFYVPDDYAENLVRQYTGQERKNMIAHLKHTLRILKFYTNNDFAFKDVHNEQLFLQNGKILVEVVQLFEKFRIIGSENLQMLGDLFEQLLSKGFKQNEGQFFTPVPITRFIWNSLPVEKILKTEEGAGLPKIIDYACGAGHFLTEGFEAVSACVKANDSLRELDRSFAENNIFGIEKDYRLARVSKISLFMHGAGEGNIIFGDGLENYPDKNIKPNTFDILVANPPYSVSAFKPHLKLKNNSFSILDTISNNGSEIETLFVERISQLLKPNAVAAVILPSSILNKENESFICARESILKNFKIRAIVLMGNKTFDITIGDRVLSEEIVSGGRVPVYSANVYEEFGRIDKENMKDYSRPSVIWGIDGDWMVNIIPAGVPFYPTDHCGVLRIKTEKILPEYMMYALQAEGEYERFSRNNRASAQRIRSLVVQAPETKIQKNIIDELKALDDKINGQNAEIEKYENSIRTKFDQIFHLEEFISDGVFSKYEGYSVEDLCIDGRGRVINQQYIENHKGPYPVYSSQTTNDGIFGSIDTFDFDGEYITWTTDGAKAGTVFYRNGKFNCTNVCGTLKAKNDKVNMRYLAYLLNRIAYKFVSRVGNNKLMNDAMKKIVVPVPKRQLQDEFADFVQSVEKSKFECIGKKEKFEIEKDTFVHKYFR